MISFSCYCILLSSQIIKLTAKITTNIAGVYTCNGSSSSCERARLAWGCALTTTNRLSHSAMSQWLAAGKFSCIFLFIINIYIYFSEFHITVSMCLVLLLLCVYVYYFPSVLILFSGDRLDSIRTYL